MATSITQLLRQKAFDWHDCLDALRGKALPRNLGNPDARLCLVSGLRKHAAFARTAEVHELCQTEGQDIFARARNAGLIQDNQIPDIELLRNRLWQPYCIWYPRLATEDTYRKLVAISPDMRYQVGRACAVGGFSDLYNELDLLPDPSIAEEARENRQGPAAEGAQRIYEQIMDAPTRYGVLNDYTRTVELDSPQPGAYLNADTAVFSTLKQRFRASRQCSVWPIEGKLFDITEDGALDEKDAKVDIAPHILTPREMDLFESPLPFDLPTRHKDLLILVAAFEGNLDRYARLRRPGRVIKGELNCVIAGVYKSTALAHWLSRNPDIVSLLQTQQVIGPPGPLNRAIHARRVMNNDVRYLRDAHPPVPQNELPYFIWTPTMPQAWTLETLAEALPAMRPQCARACIAGNLRDSYLKIMEMRDEHGKPVAVDQTLLSEARLSRSYDFFQPDLAQRIREQKLELHVSEENEWKFDLPWYEAEKSRLNRISSFEDSYDAIHRNLDYDSWEELEDVYASDLGNLWFYLSTPPHKRGHMDEKMYERIKSNLRELSERRLEEA
ncbi:hypothetical protein PMIN06_003707 [Paraphaeosphaeria minitans]|uniref:Uncharacterized protein n=1 Tax=Paraphaeosphaeria minitans TaxID=565426 RepID=A0A9P6GLX7_9PLEO|nr:hypothetical protein PMIN01_05282 [Paraphaeosphaeria minitans]